MQKLFIIVVILFSISLAFIIFLNSQKVEDLPTQLTPTPGKKTNDVNVDKKATFAIFTNGTLRDFTASMYHNRSRDVFIQGNNLNVVHVKKERIKWGDFFATLPMKLNNECLTTGTGQTFCTNSAYSLKFYINGKRADDFLTKEIQDGDQALITYGSETVEQLKPQFKQLPRPN